MNPNSPAIMELADADGLTGLNFKIVYTTSFKTWGGGYAYITIGWKNKGKRHTGH